MNAIPYAIAAWVLLQLLFVLFGARLVAVRQLDAKDCLELQAYRLRSGLGVSAPERQQQSLPGLAARSGRTLRA
jgi:hypothetical protein